MSEFVIRVGSEATVGKDGSGDAKCLPGFELMSGEL